MNNAGLGGLDRLRPPRRPPDDGLLDARPLPQAEVQAAHVLRRIAVAAGDLLQLLVDLVVALVLPVQPYPRADGAAVAAGALQPELHPAVLRRDAVAVQQ